MRTFLVYLTISFFDKCWFKRSTSSTKFERDRDRDTDRDRDRDNGQGQAQGQAQGQGQGQGQGHGRGTRENGDMTLHIISHSLRGSEVISFAVQQGCALVEWKDQVATHCS